MEIDDSAHGRDQNGQFEHAPRPEPEAIRDSPRRNELQAVLESAARLQQIVPDAVLVGGTAAAAYAAHRLSFDHDHVVSDLVERFDIVLEALEREPDWITNRVVPGKVILGELGGIEAGVRQLRRRTPLETETCHLPGGRSVVVPTVAETLRVKGYLIVKRNQVRDYLDVAALADRYGIEWAAHWLAGIDEYYEDLVHDEGPVASQLVVQLADPHPKDVRTIRDLPRYKGLERRWQDWNATRAVLAQVAEAMAN